MKSERREVGAKGHLDSRTIGVQLAQPAGRRWIDFDPFGLPSSVDSHSQCARKIDCVSEVDVDRRAASG